jgi:anti-sigma-K factor RskA
MSIAEIHVLAGAYALDAVTDLERAAFDRHLRDCSVCAQEVREFRETAMRLGAATAVAPDQALRERVLREISVTRQQPPRIAELPVVRERSWWTRRAAIAVVSIAAAAAALFGGINIGRDQLRQVVPGNSVSASDTVTDSAEGATGGSATVAVTRSQHTAVVNVRDLPALDVAHSYQLWFTGLRGPRSAGSLPAGAGSGTVSLNVPADADGLAVTVEPAGGSSQPTTPGVLRLGLA